VQSWRYTDTVVRRVWRPHQILLPKEFCVRNPLCVKPGEPQPAVALRQMQVFLGRRTHLRMAVMREGYPAAVTAWSTQIMASNVTWVP